MDENAIKRAEYKAKAIDLLGGVCVHCGGDGTSERVIDRLEFDHLKNEKGKRRLSSIWNCSWASILTELKKCQLLCRHCHAVKSQVERGNLTYSQITHGTTMGYTYRKCRCMECKRAWADYKIDYWHRKTNGTNS